MFSKNLQYLRKRDKITQEDLADRLGVSRQSVSKWETGDAYPETDKLIMLCDLFAVSLDDLLRKDITAEPDKRSYEEYSAHMNRFARNISAGVFLILMGVAVCLALSGYSLTLQQPQSDTVATLGAVAVILFVAPAVFLFVFSGLKQDAFKRENPEPAVFPEPKTQSFLKRFAVAMGCLVSGILLDVVFLVVFSLLIDGGILSVGNADEAYCYVVAAFMAVLAFIVCGLVYAGIVHSKYSLENRPDNKPRSPRQKLKDALCGAVMLSATAIFLIVGFVWGLWHPGWVAFPVGGILCGIISTVIDATDK